MRSPLQWQAWQGVHHAFLLVCKTPPNLGINETLKLFKLNFLKRERVFVCRASPNASLTSFYLREFWKGVLCSSIFETDSPKDDLHLDSQHEEKKPTGLLQKCHDFHSLPPGTCPPSHPSLCSFKLMLLSGGKQLPNTVPPCPFGHCELGF